MGKEENNVRHEKTRARWYIKLRSKLGGAKGLLAVSAVAVLLLAAIIVVPMIIKSYGLWQAHRLVMQGEEALKNEEWEKASDSFGKAFLKAPRDPQTIRGIANFMRTIGGDPEKALFFWRQLVSLNAATDEDIIYMAGAILASGKSAAARQALIPISEESRNTKIYLELEAAILQSEGRQAEAESTMRQALLRDPTNLDSQLKLASMDLRNPLSEVQDQAIRTLWRLAKGTDKTAQSAMDILARDSRTTREQYTELLNLASSKETSTGKLHFVILRQMLGKFPDIKEQTLTAEEQKLAELPSESRIPYYLMLQELGENKRLLDKMPKEQMTKSREIFAIYSETMAAMGRWQELKDMIKKAPSLPATALDLSLLLARCSKGLNEPDKVIKGYLTEASNLAISSRDNRTIQRVCQFTASFGYPEVAIAALRTGIVVPQQRVALLELILKMQTDQRQSEKMLQTIREILSTDSKLSYLQERSLYLRLLVGQDMETVSLEASDLASTSLIDGTTFELLSAMFAYRSGNRQALVAALEKLPNPEKFDPGQRAVYSGLLSVSGQPAKAFSIAEKIQPSLLLEEERRFLMQAL